MFFENPIFTFEGQNRNTINESFFTPDEFERSKDNIRSLKFENLLDNLGNILTHPNLTVRTGINFTNTNYEKIRRIVNRCNINYLKAEPLYKKSISAAEFFSKNIKGSKRFRKVITFSSPDTISSNILRYGEIIDTVINLEESKKLNALWGLSFFDNSTKSFIFKLHNNQLGTNSRVAHFVRGHDKSCTFCTLNNIAEENSETINHLFFDCIYTERLLERFYSYVFSVPYRMVTRKEFITGFILPNEADVFVLDIITTLAKKFIWDCKLRFTTPQLNDLVLFIRSEILRIVMISRKFSAKFNKSPLFSANHNFRF